MADSSSTPSLCPPPFLQESLFPPTDGYIPGRYCSVVPGVANGQACCLPCPATDWLYPDNFYSLTRVPGYINVVALALSAFMLLSFAVLPVEKTRRHYLNVCLLVSILFLQLGFIVPWARRPQQCHNAITPEDMYSSMVCAWSGGLVVFGGVAVNMWILIRALSMHLQICWDIIPGKRFFWFAQVLGWAISAVLLSTEISMSGVSFRFGDYCHVNHTKSLGTLWGPLLGFSGISITLQLATFVYCLNVYLKHSFASSVPDTESSRGKSSTGSLRSANARTVFRRLKKVLSIQWRGLAIATLVVADCVFFSIVFVVLDSQTQRAVSNPEAVFPWLSCIVLQGDKNKCLHLASAFVVGEEVLIATLLLLAVAGIEAFILICRVDMITGWCTVCKTLWKKQKEKREFVSLNAHESSHDDKKTYELERISPARPPDSEMMPPSHRSDPFTSPIDLKEPSTYAEKTAERAYRSPSRSFSNLRPPSSRLTTNWDASDPHHHGPSNLHLTFDDRT